MFDHFCGEGNYETLFCGQGELFRIPELKQQTNAYLETVTQAGKEYARGKISPETQADLKNPLFPRETFEKMADASWGISEETNASDDDSLSFTKQMTALYTPDGVERVLEMCYTDINKTYQLLLTKEGSEVITGDFKKYTTRIETPYSLWRSIARGEISGQNALFQKKYSVSGDFKLMLAWDELFGGISPSIENKSPEKSKSEKYSNMNIFLMPWIVIWIALAINPIVGGIIGIGTSVLLPLLWIKFRPAIFEQLTIPLVTAISLGAMQGMDLQILIPLSYGIFGAMWLISSFFKTPLSAYYSSNSYGGDSACENPLFIRTNRILTVAWGVLYLVTPIWTYFLMETELSVYTGLINSVCPALIGIFTLWFQKWYPAYFAKK